MVASIFRLVSAGTQADPSTPRVIDVTQHLLATLCGELMSEIHFASDDHVREVTARRYYGTLFLVWFATQDRAGGKILDLDVRDYVRAFLRDEDKEHFASLIDYDDPLSWFRLPDGSNHQRVIGAIGGLPYYTWVLEQTKNPEAYHAAVKRFRAFVATIHTND